MTSLEQALEAYRRNYDLTMVKCRVRLNEKGEYFKEALFSGRKENDIVNIHYERYSKPNTADKSTLKEDLTLVSSRHTILVSGGPDCYSAIVDGVQFSSQLNSAKEIANILEGEVPALKSA